MYTCDLYFHRKLGLKFYLDVVLKSLKFNLFIPVDTLFEYIIFHLPNYEGLRLMHR